MPLEIGRGRIMREGTKIALLSFGGRLAECLKAAQELGAYGLSTTVADARFAKPLDTDLINRLAREHEVVITIEEGAIGGFGSHVLHHLAMSGLLDHGLKIRTMVLPDVFLDHDSPQAQYDAGRAQRPPHRRHGAVGARPRNRRAAGPGINALIRRPDCPAAPRSAARAIAGRSGSRAHACGGGTPAGRAPPAGRSASTRSSKSSISSWNRRCQFTLALQVQKHRAEPDRGAVHEDECARRRDAAQPADVAVHVSTRRRPSAPGWRRSWIIRARSSSSGP